MCYCNGCHSHSSGYPSYESTYCPSVPQYLPVTTSYSLVNDACSRQAESSCCNTASASSASCGCNGSSYSSGCSCCRCCWFR